MYKIATLNKISPVGLAKFTDNYSITDNVAEAAGILVRSQDMLTMDFSDELRSIARAGAGVNNIPLDRCAESGIAVFNTPGANANAVNELAVCGMLMAMRNVPAGIKWAETLKPNADMDVAKQVEKGKSRFAGNEVLGKTVGIVGFGAIGQRFANACLGLGMEVIGFNRSPKEIPGVKRYDDLKEMLSKCDIVSLNFPVNDSTKKMVNDDLFAAMKDGVIVLNFARDKIVNEADLLAALESGKVAKYVCDFPTDNMVGRENVILIPHLGASSEEAEDNCAIMAVNETREFLENGNLINSVNFPSLNMGDRGSKTRIAFMTKGLENPLTDIMSKIDVKADNFMAARREDGIAYVLVELADGAEAPAGLQADFIINTRIMK